MWLGILPDLPLFYRTCPVSPTLLGKTAGIGTSQQFQTKIKLCIHNIYRSLGLEKNIVCFRFPTDPIKTCATQIYFMGFKIFFLGNALVKG